jgi:hypothetical protein
MSDQVSIRARLEAAAPEGGLTHRLDAAIRLGPRPVALWLADRALDRLGVARWLLADRPAPAGRFLPDVAPPAPPLPRGAAAVILAAAAALPERMDWHGGFDARAHALRLDLASARPVWEAGRLAALPLLAMAERIAPRAGHLLRAEALLLDWCRANPPFRGVGWACAQEAALRALHLALALALLNADRDPPPAARALLACCARRIAATPWRGLAQDNNHPLSEAAGAFACALLLGRPTGRHAAALAARVARLVAPDGGFAQVSAGYARLALDVLAIAEWLRARLGAAPFPMPLAARAGALAAWLHRLVAPEDGGTPRLGLEDDSAFADLSLAGPHDARASVERAARLFGGQGADRPEDPGCAWLGLPRPGTVLPRPARWRAAGSMGWQDGGSLAVLRTGPLRFRPGQSDLLHLSLRHRGHWVLRDGGTGRYDPPEAWWWGALVGGAAHNAPVFDEAEPMPRVGPFLLGRWPRIEALPGGAALADARANRTIRTLHREGGAWLVEDRVAGAFRRVAWHWRLCPADWRLRPDGIESELGRIAIAADAPFGCALVEGWESPAYGAIRPAPVLRVGAAAPLARLLTRIELA